MGLAEVTLVASCFLGFLGISLYYLYEIFWARPERKRAILRRQGIKGPPPSPFLGNVRDMRRTQSEEKARKATGHDCAAIIFPFFDRWRSEYGSIFVFSMGNMVSLYVRDLDLVKEIGQCKSLDLGKPSYLQKELRALLGHGILASNRSTWAHQRKVIAPEFFMDKVKGMVELMVEAAIPWLESWESRVQCEGGTAVITVDQDLRGFSADVISRACFGSNYSKGKSIFDRLWALQMAKSKRFLLIGIPGSRYLPTKNNLEIWRLEREIRLLILKVVKERQEKFGASSEKDLLQSLIESGDGYVGPDTTIDGFIVDNCKNIYFAGHETTALSAAWCLMLLASYPEWQARARDEVVEICGDQPPTIEVLRKMKTLTMVIQETLRLYAPAFFTSRETLQDLKFGDIHIPEGTIIRIPISKLHTDPEIWGPDAHEFNPERFAQRISGACKFPHAYIPFGLGTRSCVGQHFAMVELKIVLSLILSKFTFSLSPKYCHSPAFRLTLEPEFGVPLMMNKA
uniref:Cytochrome P450 734A1 n=1 Tax=Anthurium amnicola TaxID=1678845 RepID=A0A1D1XMK0_9ARAE